RKITGLDEVALGLNMPVLGTLPALPVQARRAVVGTARGRDLYWQGLLTEAVDAVRTQLLHPAPTGDLHAVMVTRAGGGRGTTSLASPRAATRARAWKKTLLIDGALRTPAAHRLFTLPLEPGFSEVLRGEVDAGEAIRPTPVSRLWMLPAGHWDSHA